MSSHSETRRISVRDVRDCKGTRRVVAVTAYDALFGRLVDQSGVDIVLVGDSVANVFAGYDSTLPITLDQMIYHGASVCRGVKRALVTVDMPFLTYQIDAPRAVENCGRVIQETGAQAVKVEGGSERIASIVATVVDVGVPVMGHVGFTPQSVNALGGFRVQGRDPSDADRIVDDAKRLEQSGVFAIVLELLPAAVAERVTAAVTVPTIGIGAGASCDGQVLVLPDLLGLNEGFAPKFLKHYASLAATVRGAVSAYAEDVREGRYPADEHSF